MGTAKATYGPKDVARTMAGKGRKLDAKRVRAWVREHVARFDDDGYTSHEYSAAEYRTIVAGLSGAAKAGRTRAAVKGRAETPRKPRKAPPVREMGSGPVPAGPAVPSAS